MTIPSQEELQFMLELHAMTNGDITAQISMYDVGTHLGMDKTTASDLSQDLIIGELVELKTLSGGIGITPKGLELLRSEGRITSVATETIQLSKGPVLDVQDRQHLDKLLREIRAAACDGKSSYAQLEEFIIDLKTLDTQLLSPRPKTKIVQATLESMLSAAEKFGSQELSRKVRMLVHG